MLLVWPSPSCLQIFPKYLGRNLLFLNFLWKCCSTQSSTCCMTLSNHTGNNSLLNVILHEKLKNFVQVFAKIMKSIISVTTSLRQQIWNPPLCPGPSIPLFNKHQPAFCWQLREQPRDILTPFSPRTMPSPLPFSHLSVWIINRQLDPSLCTPAVSRHRTPGTASRQGNCAGTALAKHHNDKHSKAQLAFLKTPFIHFYRSNLSLILISSDSDQPQHQLVSVSEELTKPGWFVRQCEKVRLVFVSRYISIASNTMHQHLPTRSERGAVFLRNWQLH